MTEAQPNPVIEEATEVKPEPVVYENGYQVTQVNMTVSAKMNLGNYENVDHAINVTFKLDDVTPIETAVNHLRPRMQVLLRSYFAEVFAKKLEAKQQQSQWKDVPAHIQTWLKDIADMAQFVAAQSSEPQPTPETANPLQSSFLNSDQPVKDTTYADQ